MSREKRLETVFLDIGLILVFAGVLAYTARVLRQPLIPAFILGGILLGPVLGIITDREVIVSLSEIGISFLLFSAGLELKFNRLKEVGDIAIIGTLTHMLVIFGAGFFAFRFLGYDALTSMYVGLVLIFSSTLVVVKLLSDKHELDTLHGRIIVGILLMQDIVAIIALSFLNSIGKDSLQYLLLTFTEGALVLAMAIIAAKLIFQSLFNFAARHDEVLFLMSLTMMFTFAILYNEIGFSIAIGAFIAGLLIGQLPYKLEIMSQIKGIKEFFSVLFFVSVGMSLIPVPLSEIAVPVTVLFIITSILVPLSFMSVLAYFGYKRRTAFLTSTSLSQISEFSLIIITIGFVQGHVTSAVYSTVILLALITITTTSYLIAYGDKIYNKIGHLTRIFDWLSSHHKEEMNLMPENHEIILVGYDRVGYSIFQKLQKLRRTMIIVDLNPDVIRRLIKEKIPCIYGDISDSEIIDRLMLEDVGVVISTIPKHDDSMLLIEHVRKKSPQATVIVTSYTAHEALDLYEHGADYVIVPHYLGGEHLSLLMGELTGNNKKRARIKNSHIRALQERRQRHPHHD